MDDFEKLLLILTVLAMFKIELTIKSRDKLTSLINRLINFFIKR